MVMHNAALACADPRLTIRRGHHISKQTDDQHWYKYRVELLHRGLKFLMFGEETACWDRQEAGR